ncbi:MAG: phosphate ABC transporter permease PstA [Selenomonadaceae bacterium]
MMSRSFKNKLFKGAVHASAALTVLFLIFTIGYIFMRGLPHVSWKLISSQASYISNIIGIFPNIMNTLYIIGLTIAIALPLSIGAAIYLTEYTVDDASRMFARIIAFAMETLASIPSIIFGLVGMMIFTQLFGIKQGVLVGSLTLVMMILPTIIRTTQESLATVPQEWRQGALALGAGKWFMIRTIVLPSAARGIVAGVILAIGRIAGESAALLFTAGFGLVLHDFFRALTSSSASLTVALYVYASERGETDVAFAIAVILMAIVLALNTFTKLLTKFWGNENVSVNVSAEKAADEANRAASHLAGIGVCDRSKRPQPMVQR